MTVFLGRIPTQLRHLTRINSLLSFVHSPSNCIGSTESASNETFGTGSIDNECGSFIGPVLTSSPWTGYEMAIKMPIDFAVADPALDWRIASSVLPRRPANWPTLWYASGADLVLSF